MDAFVAMLYRQLKRFVRAKVRVIMTVAMPVIWIAFYGIGWASTLNFPGIELILGTDYLSFMIPGVIAMTIFISSFMSGMAVIWDKQFGFLKEVLVAPTPRWQSISGRIFGDSIVASLQGIVLALLGFAVAPSLSLGGLPVVALVSFLTALGFTSIGIAIASSKAFKSVEAFQGLVNILMMPLIFASGAFFPLTNVPSWFKAISYLDPLTYSTDAMRGALAGVSQFGLYEDLSALIAFSLISVALAIAVFERSTLD